jgi:hypothetical protein
VFSIGRLSTLGGAALIPPMFIDGIALPAIGVVGRPPILGTDGCAGLTSAPIGFGASGLFAENRFGSFAPMCAALIDGNFAPTCIAALTDGILCRGNLPTSAGAAWLSACFAFIPAAGFHNFVGHVIADGLLNLVWCDVSVVDQAAQHSDRERLIGRCTFMRNYFSGARDISRPHLCRIDTRRF